MSVLRSPRLRAWSTAVGRVCLGLLIVAVAIRPLIWPDLPTPVVGAVAIGLVMALVFCVAARVAWEIATRRSGSQGTISRE